MKSLCPGHSAVLHLSTSPRAPRLCVSPSILPFPTGSGRCYRMLQKVTFSKAFCCRRTGGKPVVRTHLPPRRGKKTQGSARFFPATVYFRARSPAAREWAGTLDRSFRNGVKHFGSESSPKAPFPRGFRNDPEVSVPTTRGRRRGRRLTRAIAAQSSHNSLRDLPVLAVPIPQPTSQIPSRKPPCPPRSLRLNSALRTPHPRPASAKPAYPGTATDAAKSNDLQHSENDFSDNGPGDRAECNTVQHEGEQMDDKRGPPSFFAAGGVIHRG